MSIITWLLNGSLPTTTAMIPFGGRAEGVPGRVCIPWEYLGNALAEASYMVGLERNAGAVKLACYAPLFCNVDYTNWQPDMIWFDNHRSYGTPNYYIQKLFHELPGDYTLPLIADFAEENEYPGPERQNISRELVFAAGQEDGKVVYSRIEITNDDTNETYRFRISQ